MTNLTFYGGVKDIGGNKFLVDDKGTKIFMDFGMSFTEEGRFFAEFLKARTSNSLIDMFELGNTAKDQRVVQKRLCKAHGLWWRRRYRI